MAMIDWPWNLCTVVLEGYEIDQDEPVRRTEMDDGLVQQKTRFSEVFKLRSFDVLVKESDIPAFRRWVADNGNTFFNFRDFEDGTVRETRVRGGKIPLQRSGSEWLDGERLYRGSVTLEGFE